MSGREEILKKLTEAVINCDPKSADKAAREAIEVKIKPYDAIINGLTPGMKVVGNKYESKEYFIPDVLLAADAMYAGLNLLLPLIPKSETRSKGKIVLGTVEGDVHDIGKNIVKIMLVSSGYEVIDLGKDVPTDEFIKKAEEEGAQVIAMSTLMTPTLLSMKAVEEQLKSTGLKEKVKTIIGGGAVSEEWRKKMGSDAYGKDAGEAVDKVKQLIQTIIAASEVMKKKRK